MKSATKLSHSEIRDTIEKPSGDESALLRLIHDRKGVGYWYCLYP